MSHPLHLAVTEHSPEQIKRLLALGTYVDDLDEDGNTPLMLALSLNQNSYYYEPLVKAGACLTATNHVGMNPLMIALDKCHPCYIDELLGWFRVAGVTPYVDASVATSRFALLFAIYNNDEQEISRLVAGGADVNSRHGHEQTPLMMAASLGHVAAMRTLLHGGADLLAVDDNHNYAFTLAAESVSAECVLLLLDAGADPNQADEYGYTPLILVAFAGFSPEVVRKLLSHGANVHATSTDGDTALTQAALIGSADIVGVLLEYGAGKDKASLQRAYRASFTDNGQNCAPILLAAGATIGIREAIAMQDTPRVLQLLGSESVDSAGFGPAGGELLLDAVRSNCDTKIIAALLKLGACVNTRSKRGIAAINIVSKTINESALTLLLEAGADVNVVDKRGYTPLMSYAGRGRIEAVTRILECGADVSIRNNRGRTALMRAVNEGHHDVVKLLLQRGGDADDRDCEGVTALQLAQAWNHKDIVDLLVSAGAQG